MRMPYCRPTLALSAAVGALVFATPALGQAAADYEYAQAAPDSEVVFRSDPVIQPLPTTGPVPAPAPRAEIEPQTIETSEAPLPPAPPLPPLPPYAEAVPIPPPPGGYASQHAYEAPAAPHGYAPPESAAFDREVWLDECRDRIRDVDRRDRARVIGGLLGAAAGGVIGNRAWGSKRLAGTLLGAGVGGLAGVAVGSAIGAANERRQDDECALYLDRYASAGFESGYPGYGAPYGYPGPVADGYGYGGYGYAGYAYPYGYTLVPVLVAVPQRQVVRETVTEEWIDEPAPARPVTRARTIQRTKRTKYSK